LSYTRLSSPKDGIVGLFILESASGTNQNSDFVFLSPLHVQNENTVAAAMSTQENQQIKDMAKGK
jgi:hypothetical protein